MVNRREPTPEDIALFDGTDLAPVGDVVSINDRFINLQPQTVSGLDLGVNWTKRRTKYGTFIVNLNASKLDEFTRDLGDIRWIEIAHIWMKELVRRCRIPPNTGKKTAFVR